MEKTLENGQIQNLFGVGYIFGFVEGKKISLFDLFNAIIGGTFLNITEHVKAKKERIAYIDEKGFEIDINNMQKGKRYLINYENSMYEIMRNNKDELELFEVG